MRKCLYSLGLFKICHLSKKLEHGQGDAAKPRSSKKSESWKSDNNTFEKALKIPLNGFFLSKILVNKGYKIYT
jgi:hypothetical protein